LQRSRGISSTIRRFTTGDSGDRARPVLTKEFAIMTEIAKNRRFIQFLGNIENRIRNSGRHHQRGQFISAVQFRYSRRSWGK